MTKKARTIKGLMDAGYSRKFAERLASIPRKRFDEIKAFQDRRKQEICGGTA